MEQSELLKSKSGRDHFLTQKKSAEALFFVSELD